jgi:hypothetical protein
MHHISWNEKHEAGWVDCFFSAAEQLIRITNPSWPLIPRRRQGTMEPSKPIAPS